MDRFRHHSEWALEYEVGQVYTSGYDDWGHHYSYVVIGVEQQGEKGQRVTTELEYTDNIPSLYVNERDEYHPR